MATDNYQGGSEINLSGFFQGLVGNLYKNQATIAKRKADEAKATSDVNKEISALVGKVSPNGVQQKDVEEFSKMYDEIKELNFKASKAASTTEARKLQAEIQGKIQQTNLFVNQSKQAGQQIVKFADEVQRNSWGYNDTVKAHLKKLQDTPTSKLLTTDYDYSNFKPSPDAVKMDTINDSIFKEAVLGARNNPALRRMTQSGITDATGQRGTLFREVAAGQTGAVIERMKQEYSVNPQYRAYYDDKAKQSGIPPEAVIAKDVVDANKAGRLNWMGDGSIKYPSKGKSGSGDDDGTGSEYLQGETVQNFGSGNTTTTAKNFVSIATTPTLTAGGTFTMQNSQGQKVKLNSTADEFKLVGVGLYPVVKKDINSKVKKGDIATSDFAAKNPNAVEYVEKAVVRGNADKYEKMFGIAGSVYFADPKEVLSKAKLTKKQAAAYKELQALKPTAKPSTVKASTPAQTPKPVVKSQAKTAPKKETLKW